MGVYRFEDLRVWKAAKEQCDRIGALINRPGLASDFALRDHLNDASISTMNNISEGFVRRRDAEMLQFLRYAAASNAEVRTCLYAAEGRRYLDKEETTDLLRSNDSIGKMLRRFIESIRTRDRTRDQGRTRDQERTRDQGPRTKDDA